MIVAALMAAATLPSIAELLHRRRVLVVAAPDATDPRVTAQRDALAGWAQGAADRDVTTVEIIGDRVTGVRDDATTLRHRYRLAPTLFTVVLIGKDGHEALRASDPLSVQQLQGAIDAMPMRRAGQR